MAIPQISWRRHRAFFKDGLAHGEAKSWHFNGRLASQCKYARGQIAGEIMRWSEAVAPAPPFRNFKTP